MRGKLSFKEVHLDDHKLSHQDAAARLQHQVLSAVEKALEKGLDCQVMPARFEKGKMIIEVKTHPAGTLKIEPVAGEIQHHPLAGISTYGPVP